MAIGGGAPGQQRSLTVGGRVQVQGSAAVSEALGESSSKGRCGQGVVVGLHESLCVRLVS